MEKESLIAEECKDNENVATESSKEDGELSDCSIDNCVVIEKDIAIVDLVGDDEDDSVIVIEDAPSNSHPYRIRSLSKKLKNKTTFKPYAPKFATYKKSLDIDKLVIKDSSPCYKNLPKPKYHRRDKVIRCEIITIDDDLIESPAAEPAEENSVIFLSETTSNSVPVINKKAKMSFKNFRKKRLRMGNTKMATDTNKQIPSVSNNNNFDVPVVKVRHKRLVVIDGSNVAYAHGKTDFSIKGIEICLNYFTKLGHEAIAVLPRFRANKFKSSDPNRLDELHLNGQIIFTPCKNIKGSSSNPYDDRMILQIAQSRDAAVVSNDNYNDLIDEDPEFRNIIETRVLGYTFCGDDFFVPNDPYGRKGPSLNQILYREV